MSARGAVTARATASHSQAEARPHSASGNRAHASLAEAAGPVRVHGAADKEAKRVSARDVVRRGSHGENSIYADTSHSLQHLTAHETRAAQNTRKASRHEEPEVAADRATQDRVHAWYTAHQPLAPVERATKHAHQEGTADRSPVERNVAGSIPAAPPMVSTHRVAEASLPATTASTGPDLSPVARKATVADFDRALRQKTEAMHATAAENQTRTTAQDDAAEAATHIPSTAPTERVAAPFTHGDLLSGAAASATSADFLPRPTLVTSKGLKLAKPAKAEAVAEGDDLKAGKHAAAIRTDADALAASPAAASTASPAEIRAIAAQTAASPTPKPQIIKPVPVVRVPDPAVAAVTAAAAKKPKLDPTVVAGMTEETFDASDDPMTNAKTAVVLSAATAKADPLVKSPVVPLTEDMDTGAGLSPAVRVNLYDREGRMLLLPPMKGTHEILVHQNQQAVADGLDRIEDDDQLREMRRLKLLVALPDNESITVDERLPYDRRYARPWSVRFLNDLAKAHYARFGTPLIVTSAVRTVAFQRRLVLTNGNAAPPTGEVASPHLYGQAVDIAKHGMSVTEIAWMRAYLTPVESDSKIDVEEEFQQACFHISIYRRYLGLPARQDTPPAQPLTPRTLQQAKAVPPSATTTTKRHRISAALLAAGVRYR